MKPEIKRKTFLGISLAAVAAMGSRLFGQQTTSSNIEKALNSEGLTEQRVRELLAACVPVGGIIPHVGELTLPSNWQVCDGSDLRPEANAALKSRLNGKTPSMIGRVPRGVAAADKVAVFVGEDRVQIPAGGTEGGGAHSHTVANHTHALPDYTGSISLAAPSRSRFTAICDGGGTVGNARLVADCNFTDGEGQHRHDLGGRTGSEAPRTNEESAHSHAILARVVDHVPASTTVVYIIRIF